ncbi:MAG: ferric reductase-like transmembrane domain-containing protein [Rhizobiaceae bacterium]
MRPIGLLIVAALLAAPLIEFAPLTAQHDPSAVFSQYIGCVALIAMAIGQVLATRLPFVEPLFGGLDRVYVLHKWLGIGALAAVLIHDTVDAEIDGLAPETWLTDLAETLGEISLYGFVILVLITIVTFIPYHLWRWSHKLMGTFFALSVFHFAFMSKPFANTDMTGSYMLAICAAGLVAYVYTLLPSLGRRTAIPYEVEKVEQSGGAITVGLKPMGKAIKQHAGQFAFVSFDLPQLNETHPFTISSAPREDQTLQFTIKPLGDYTARLEGRLKQGTKATLSPAYGHFRLRSGAKAQIWVAAGIGITPFKAWLEDVTPEHGKIDLFFCFKGHQNAPHLAHLEALAAQLDNVTLHKIDSRTEPRLTAATIDQATDGDLKKAQVYFCGPAGMRESLRRDLQSKGVANRRFHYEEFEIRSGIGVRKFINFAMQKSGLARRYPDAIGKMV